MGTPEAKAWRLDIPGQARRQPVVQKGYGHLSEREIWEMMWSVNRALAQTSSTSRSPCCGS